MRQYNCRMFPGGWHEINVSRSYSKIDCATPQSGHGHTVDNFPVTEYVQVHIGDRIYRRTLTPD